MEDINKELEHLKQVRILLLNKIKDRDHQLETLMQEIILLKNK
jgi:predicted RNA-binding protein with PUA domain